MLTEQEKQRIQIEETYRHELRQQLERQDNSHPKSQKERVWTFLNSSLGLWLLSSVAIGLITWGYSQWIQSHAQESSRSELVRKLDTEIGNRLRYFEISFNDSKDNDIGDYEKAMRILLRRDEPSEDRLGNVFPEFERRTLQALLWELYPLVPQSEKAEIYRALESIDSLVTLENKIDTVDDLSKTQQDIEQVRKIIAQNFHLQRWTISQQ